MVVISVIVIVLLFSVYASAFIGSGVYIRTSCRVKTDKKIVALTFDDGPDRQQTPKILDILKENDLKAVFFCIGQKAEQHPDIVRRIVREGHLIGNHSYSHCNMFPLFGRKKMVEDLKKCDEIILRETGERPVLFRPPFGVTNPTIAFAVRMLGYRTIGWSIRSLDTMGGDAAGRVERKLRSGAIILLHDHLENSDELLRDLIKRINDKGYKIERL